jgi:hypothetical protein
MILTDSEVASLKSAIHWWEWFGYASTGVVGLGCIGEFIAEFTSVSKSEHRKHKLSRLSLIILIFGIAGELLSAVRTSNLSGELIANIEERAANAEQKAGEANDRASANEKEAAQLRKDADAERLERMRLQAAIQPRTLTLQQQKDLADSCRKFAGSQMEIFSFVGDAEGAALVVQIAAALSKAGIPARPRAGAVEVVNAAPPTGISISEFNPSLARVIVDSLKAAHISVTPRPATPEEHWTIMRVGIKPFELLK